MSTSIYPDQSTIVHWDPNWVRAQGYLHRNNVLFYFMESPFFDPASRNSEVMNAQQDFAHWQHAIGTVDNFHREMALRPGLEFVLAHDPEKENTMIEPLPGSGVPKGQMVRSSLFVIRKQKRLGDLRTTVPMGVYWCMNERIFQAPSVGNVLNSRILAAGAGLGKWLEKKGDFDRQAALLRAKAGDKEKKKPADGGEPGLEAAPVLGLADEAVATEKDEPMAVDAAPMKAQQNKQDEEETHDTLGMALRLMEYKDEYADEVQLMGEPGKFRFQDTRAQKKQTAEASEQSLSLPTQARLSRGPTPAQSRAVSLAAGSR